MNAPSEIASLINEAVQTHAALIAAQSIYDKAQAHLDAKMAECVAIREQRDVARADLVLAHAENASAMAKLEEVRSRLIESQ